MGNLMDTPVMKIAKWVKNNPWKTFAICAIGYIIILLLQYIGIAFILKLLLG